MTTKNDNKIQSREVGLDSFHFRECIEESCVQKKTKKKPKGTELLFLTCHKLASRNRTYINLV